MDKNNILENNLIITSHLKSDLETIKFPTLRMNSSLLLSNRNSFIAHEFSPDLCAYNDNASYLMKEKAKRLCADIQKTEANSIRVN